MADIDKAILTQEIATVQQDVTFPAFAGILRVTDDTLITRGGGKGLKIYDEIERDARTYAMLQKRKLAVIARPWQVDPASSSRADTLAADIVRAQISSDSFNFDHVSLNLLDAILKGFAIGEIMWGTDGSEIVATEVRPRDQRRFLFDDQWQPRLKIPQNFLPGIPLPDRKFIVYSWGAKDGNPQGRGLGSLLFWLVFFKRQDITFWLTFCDKFGSPTAKGTYPASASEEDQDKLLAALGAIAHDAGVIVPEGMAIDLLEAARSGNANTYEQLVRYLDEEITVAVLGDAPSTKGSGGQLASAAMVREEVRLELVKADADLLSGTLNRTVAKWITELNVPGATPPRIWRKVEAPKDLGGLAQRDKTIFDMGFRPTLGYITETYGGEWTEMPTPPADAGDGGGGGSAVDAAAFAESAATAGLPDDIARQVAGNIADQQAMQNAGTAAGQNYQQLLGERVDGLVAMLEQSKDLVTFREQLAELLQQAPPKGLTDALTNSAFAARLLANTGK